jgi:hypothetical protein
VIGYPSLILMMLAGITVGLSIYVLAVPWHGDDRARKLCDDAVHTVLTSHDPVELQRAGILIEGLNCSVTRRLPRSN